MRILDRSFFKKTVPLAAARVFNNQHISQCRQALQKNKDMLKLERGATSIRADPSPELGTAGKKCLLLREEIKAEGEARRPTHANKQKLISIGRLNDVERYNTRACKR
jgi:tRNA (guanine37-N1)-methyltransferase